MSFLKKKDRWKRIIVFGVGTIKRDFDGNIATLTEPDDFGVRRWKFRACGGYKKSENGDRWLNQTLNFSIRADNPLAKVVEHLEENDVVDVFGILQRGKYTSPSSGALRNYYIVNLEKVVVLYHGDGSIMSKEDYSNETESVNMDDFDEDDF